MSNDAYEKHFGQLRGAKIIDFEMVPCEYDKHNTWPTFTMKRAMTHLNSCCPKMKKAMAVALLLLRTQYHEVFATNKH